jgi:hypothetical protein
MSCEDKTNSETDVMLVGSVFSPDIQSSDGTGIEFEIGDHDMTSDDSTCAACLDFKRRGMFEGECDCSLYGGCVKSFTVSNDEIDDSRADECIHGLTFDYEIVLSETVTEETYIEVEVSQGGYSLDLVNLIVPANSNQAWGHIHMDLTYLVGQGTTRLRFEILR